MSNTGAPTTAPESSPALREEAESLLRRLAGESARLREDQWTAIHALVEERRRALVVQRTGWGKSAVYFVATALLRARGAGPTVIVSPLLALMRNQIEAAERAGIRARTINSANLHEWEEIRGEVAAGEVDVLLISPERLNNPDFRDEVLPKLASEVGLLVVDEAHTVSDWGGDDNPCNYVTSTNTGTPTPATLGIRRISRPFNATCVTADRSTSRTRTFSLTDRRVTHSPLRDAVTGARH
jgi:ATP-dependent DNA helicase RecQ